MIRFYYGDNDYERNQYVVSIKQKFAQKYGAENIVKFNAENLEDCLAELINPGLFSDRRLVIAEEIFSNKHLVDKLPDILPLIPNETEMIVVDSKPDRRTKLYKLMLAGEAKEFKMPISLKQFVIEESAKQNVKVEQDAIDIIIIYTAGDIRRIVSEIAKFKALNISLSQDNVERYVEPDSSVDIFHILDDVFNQRLEQAIDKINSLKSTEDPSRFFALLSNQVFVLAAIKSGNKASNIIAKEIGVHPYVISKMSYLAKKMPESEIIRISKIIANTDMKVKSFGKDEAWMLVKLAVQQI